MRDIVEAFVALIPFLDPYPLWVKYLLCGWLLVSAVLLSALVLARPGPIVGASSESRHRVPPTPSGQEVQVQGSPGTTVYQAGRDVVVQSPPGQVAPIQSILVEARLTCTLRDGAELPPGEVDFLPIGDSHAYLESPAGRIRLDFVSPVRFHRQATNQMVVINRFSLPAGSDIHNRPFESLRNFANLSVPIVTLVYGKALATMRLLEITISVNGRDIWYQGYSYDAPFQTGPRFNVPLAAFHQKVLPQ